MRAWRDRRDVAPGAGGGNGAPPSIAAEGTLGSAGAPARRAAPASPREDVAGPTAPAAEHPDDAIPFRRHVGIRVVAAAEGRAVLVLPARPEVGNRFGNVHGGALATLVDGAMSNAILSALPRGDRIGGTIELSIRFLEPATGSVRAEGRVLRLGGRIAFAQADVWDERGRMVATAQGSYALQRRPGDEPATRHAHPPARRAGGGPGGEPRGPGPRGPARAAVPPASPDVGPHPTNP